MKKSSETFTIVYFLLAFVYILIIVPSILLFKSCGANNNESSSISQSRPSNSDGNFDRLDPSFSSSYYVLNTKTKKFHSPSCRYLPAKENAVKITKGNIYLLKDASPCGHCF